MAVSHVTALRSALADLAVDSIDAGSADANGDLVYVTSGDVEVATLGFSATAFGPASAGVATAAAVSSDTSATGGTAAKFLMLDKDNVTKILGSITAIGGGGDIEISNVVVGAGVTVSLSSLTYEAAP